MPKLIVHGGAGTVADALVERPLDPEGLLTEHSRAAWAPWRARQPEADAAPPPTVAWRTASTPPTSRSVGPTGRRRWPMCWAPPP